LDIYVSSPSEPLYNINEEIDFAAMVPLQVEKSIIENKTNLNQIQKLIIGGAPISPHLLEELKNISTKCFATYGMTETITHIAVKPLNESEEYYQALPNVNLSLDKRGCLIIDAEKVCEETVITNDIVKLLSSKTFKWLGRFDNVINSGGVKLFPESIEEKLSQVLSNRFFVASLPHEKLGEQLILIIESNAISEEELIEVKSKIHQRVDLYENPKEIFFIPNFIETPTGKIMRKKTLELIR